MNTTNLFVELMVIGVGALSAILLTVAAVFPAGSYAHLLNAESFAAIVLVPLLALTYVLGIIVDRLADRLFTRPAHRLRSHHFEDDASYHHARRTVLAGPEKIANLLEYARSRMRICRGWAVNSMLLLLAWNLFADGRAAFLGTALLFVLLAGSIFAWRMLVASQYRKVLGKYEFICNQAS